MSTSATTHNCSICHKNLPSLVFVRNQRTNTFYKTCSICRTRINVRRQNIRRQQSDAPPPPIASINDVMSIGNENNTDIIDPQLIDIEMEMETNSRITENTNLDFNTNNLDSNSDLVYCNRCKQNQDPTLFTGRIRGKTYKSCSNCRQRDYNRRHPQAPRGSINVETHLTSFDITTDMKYCSMCKKNCDANLFISTTGDSPFTTCYDCRLSERSRRLPSLFHTRPTEINTMHQLSQVSNIYDASDNENTNLDENLRVPGDEIIVGEEAIGNDEPVIFISHTDTREYENHMRARDTLPENHDDILNNVQELNHADENIDPFENASQYLNNENYLTTANNHTSINANEEPITIINDNERREIEEDTTTT
ncbi:hypothetical protein FRX31_003778, partial [Thalictrum thalictroides]